MVKPTIFSCFDTTHQDEAPTISGALGPSVGSAQSPPRFCASDITEFFHLLFDGVTQTPSDGPLYLCIAGIRDKNMVFHEYFRWPDDVTQAAAAALALDAKGIDAYFCTHLLTDKKRRPEFAAPISCLWVDFDKEKNNEADLGKGPTPSLVVASSQNNSHAYYRLTKPIDPQRAEELNRRLGATVKGDPGGWDLTQLLRVPGTHNHKPERAAANGGQPPPVDILKKDGPQHDPSELEGTLAPDPRPPQPCGIVPAALKSDGPPVRISLDGEELWYGRKTIKTKDGATDRSETLYAIGHEMACAGVVSPEWIAQALAERDVALGYNTYVDRPEQYEIIANKVIAREQAAQAQSSQAQPTPVVEKSLLRSALDVNKNPLPPPRWLVENLFLEKQIGVIAGPTYAGKSLLAMDVGISIATKTNVVNHPKLLVRDQRRVAYVYREQGDQQWERRLFAIQRHKGVQPPGDIPFYLVSGFKLQLSDPKERWEFIQLLKSEGIEVCIFDPLSALFRCEDENAASKVIASIRDPLEQFALNGITPIAVHHSTKRAMNREPYSSADLPRGSIDISGMTGSVIGVWRSKSKGVKVLGEVRGNSVPPFRLTEKYVPAWPLTYDVDATTTIWACAPPVEELVQEMKVLDYVGAWPTSTIQEEQEENETERIVECVRRLGRATTKDIEKELGLHERTIQRYTKQLCEAGKLTSRKEGRKIVFFPLGESSDHNELYTRVA